MNDMLRLKGHFETKSGGVIGPPNIPDGCYLSNSKLDRIISDLNNVLEYWKNVDYDITPLIDVHYTRNIPKSKRIRRLLSVKSGKASKNIVGARYDKSNPRVRKHIITYCVSITEIELTIKLLKRCKLIVEDFYKGKIKSEDITSINKYGLPKMCSDIKKTSFTQIIKDVFFVDEINVKTEAPEGFDTAFVTLYNTGKSIDEIFKILSIDIDVLRIIDNSVLLSGKEYILLKNKAPYLIAMASEDMVPLYWNDSVPIDLENYSIKKPNEEPVVGVIDTIFDESVYFNKWVEYHDYTGKTCKKDFSNGSHGTEISSIIVDGPRLNPNYDDGCGNFRVRHFAVASGKYFSWYTIMTKIEEIIKTNADIKVWNFSIGSDSEIDENYISAQGYLLDILQDKYDVVFVVSGTNKTKGQFKIGAPADSINSVVVNGVDENMNSASYNRSGPVLSFYHKPDIACFGGDSSKMINVAARYKTIKKCGTSYAAAWVSRKMAYLIYILGLSNETAKALLIDSAIGWSGDKTDYVLGHGPIPRHIDNVVKSPDDEIRFIIEGETSSHEIYNYNIPVPIKYNKFTFNAKATLVYCTDCDRSQGVDYTQTELGIRFGRVTSKGIKPLNGNKLSKIGAHVYELEAGDVFRKWDNVKHVCDELKQRSIPKKTYLSNYWGIKLIRTTRSDFPKDKVVKFGIVITLKEMYGKNYLSEFIHNCQANRWIVDHINVDSKLKLYDKLKQDVDIDAE